MPDRSSHRSHRPRIARGVLDALGRRAVLPLTLVGVVAATLLVPMAPALAGAPRVGPGPRNGPTQPQVPPHTPSPLWGLAVSNSAKDPKALEADMGKSFQAQGEYTPLSGWNYPFGSVLDAKDSGARIYLNINSWRLVNNTKVCYAYKNYPTGQYDGMLQNWVNELQAFDYDDTFITFTHEPTAHSPQQPSCGTAAEYVTAFDYVYHYFRNHGITYPFVWWMVASSFREKYAHNWQPPLSDFTAVAVDGYNRFLGGFWRTPEYIFTASHDYAVSIGKPLVIGEIGTVEDKNQPQHKANWITDASNLFTSWGCDGVLWNDTDTYRPDSTKPSIDAWVAASQEGGSAPFVANVSGTPGGTDTTWVSGFQPGEHLTFRMDSPTGPWIGGAMADSSGGAQNVKVNFPASAYGGVHPLLAIGATSGDTAQGTATLSPNVPPGFDVAQGDTWTLNARGWGKLEPITVTFPGGTPVVKTSDSTGSATIPVVVPAEPYGGGYVQLSSPSFSLQVHFRTDATLTMADSGEPQGQVPATLTGYGANETVDVAIQGGPSLGTVTTGAKGGWSGNILMDTTFGRPVVTFTGETSGVEKQNAVLLAATLSLSPDQGPTGTVVTVTSGPGWIPGETVHVYVGGDKVADVTADSSGSVSTQVTVTQHQLGDVGIRLTDNQLGVTASGTFTITS